MIKSYMFLEPPPLLALIVLTAILVDHHIHQTVQEDIDDDDNIGKGDSENDDSCNNNDIDVEYVYAYDDGFQSF